MSNYITTSGDYNNPVVLASGVLGIGLSSKTKMFYNKNIKTLTIVERNGGRLIIKVESKDGRKVVVTSCLITQAESEAVNDGTASKWSRNVGAHWFAVNFNMGSDTVIIHETHVEDDDNDTWDTTIMDRTDISSISVIIFGYVE